MAAIVAHRLSPPQTRAWMSPMSAAYDASNKSSTKYRELISKAVSLLPAAPAMRRRAPVAQGFRGKG